MIPSRLSPCPGSALRRLPAANEASIRALPVCFTAFAVGISPQGNRTAFPSLRIPVSSDCKGHFGRKQCPDACPTCCRSHIGYRRRQRIPKSDIRNNLVYYNITVRTLQAFFPQLHSFFSFFLYFYIILVNNIRCFSVFFERAEPKSPRKTKKAGIRQGSRHMQNTSRP